MSDTWVEVTIPAASVLTLNSVPYEIIPALSGHKIWFERALITLVYNSVAYIFPAGTIQLAYDSSGSNVSAATSSDILTGTVDSSAMLDSIDVSAQSESYFENRAVVLKASADPTSGNSDVKIRAYYSYMVSP
jgi:hypothetical protein